eukprot:6253024-Prymnesium_polylepis.1
MAARASAELEEMEEAAVMAARAAARAAADEGGTRVRRLERELGLAERRAEAVEAECAELRREVTRLAAGGALAGGEG